MYIYIYIWGQCINYPPIWGHMPPTTGGTKFAEPADAD